MFWFGPQTETKNFDYFFYLIFLVFCCNVHFNLYLLFKSGPCFKPSLQTEAKTHSLYHFLFDMIVYLRPIRPDPLFSFLGRVDPGPVRDCQGRASHGYLRSFTIRNHETKGNNFLRYGCRQLTLFGIFQDRIMKLSW